uniref:Uncharacterized protein n=1 Tax=Caenorhabditis japonica TaxID=281687 RepID=A0A8R1DXS4_CAEJA
MLIFNYEHPRLTKEPANKHQQRDTIVSNQPTSVKSDDSLEPAEALEKNAATLTRLFNVILFYNELDSGSVSMKQFVAEVMGFQDASRFGIHNEYNFRDTVKFMNLTDLISNQPPESFAKLLVNMRQLKMQNWSSLTKAKMDEIFKFSNYQFEEKFSYRKDLDSIIDLLKDFQYGPPSSLTETKAAQIFDQVSKKIENVDSLLIEMKNLYEDIIAFEESFNRSISFILKLNEFQTAAGGTYLSILTNTFESFNSSVELFNSWMNSVDNKKIRHQLEVIKDLFSTNITSFHKQALIGFPNALNGLGLLWGEFENDWLKIVLNVDGTLDSLKKVLMPLLKLSKNFNSKERACITVDRQVHFNVADKILRTIDRIDLRKPISESNLFLKAKSDLIKFQAISGFDDSFVQEWNNVLEYSSDLTDCKYSIDQFLKSPDYSKFQIEEWRTFFQNGRNLSEHEKYDKVRKSGLFKDYSILTKSLSDKINKLEREKGREFFSKAAGLNSKLIEMNKVFEAAQAFEPMKIAVEKYGQILQLFSPISQLERKSIKSLENCMLYAKTKFIKSQKMEDDLKWEMKNYSHQLRTNLISRDLTEQLAYSQRALAFYLNPDMPGIIEMFESNGKALGEKMKSLSSDEKKIVGSGLDSIFNTSFSTLETDIKSMKSRIGPGRDLSSFAQSLNALDDITVPPLNFAQIITTLNILRSTSIGRSKEVVAIEKSLNQLVGLHFASLRKKSKMSSLIDNAEQFFKDFFKTPSTVPESSSSIYIWMAFSIFTVILIGLIATCAATFMKSKRKINYKSPQDKGSKTKNSKANDSKGIKSKSPR